MDKTVKTLEYSEENIALLKEKGYHKSATCKPYSHKKVIRYSPKRGVYWFSSSRSAHMSDCFFTQQNTRTLIILL